MAEEKLARVATLIDQLQGDQSPPKKELLEVLRLYHSHLYREAQRAMVIEKTESTAFEYNPLDICDSHRPGWAVIEPVEATDSSGLFVVRVEETPGHEGQVTRLKTGKSHPNLCLVQATRSQARTMKERIRKARGLSKWTARAHYDVFDEPPWGSY